MSVCARTIDCTPLPAVEQYRSGGHVSTLVPKSCRVWSDKMCSAVKSARGRILGVCSSVCIHRHPAYPLSVPMLHPTERQAVWSQASRQILYVCTSQIRKVAYVAGTGMLLLHRYCRQRGYGMLSATGMHRSIQQHSFVKQVCSNGGRGAFGRDAREATHTLLLVVLPMIRCRFCCAVPSFHVFFPLKRASRRCHVKPS